MHHNRQGSHIQKVEQNAALLVCSNSYKSSHRSFYPGHFLSALSVSQTRHSVPKHFPSLFLRRLYSCPAAFRKAVMFSVDTSGGIPPPHERITRRRLVVLSKSAFTVFLTSCGVPWASVSRGGMLPSSVTLSPARVCISSMA